MADLFLVREEADLAATLQFLTEELQLLPGTHVYDQCCGIGSLSIPLAQRGMVVTGADLCDFYIERARRGAAAANVDCRFECADAFEFHPPRPCDAVFNWYSSFGYAHSDGQNLQMLQRAFESLRPGGRIALDVPNVAGVLRNFQRWLVRQGTSARGSVVVVRESTVNLVRGTLDQTWTWHIEGCAPMTRRSAVRLYLPHQLRELLEQAGFTGFRCWGDLTRSPLQLDSPRLLVVAERPKA
jgi:SAM-dependent methyltransferase